MNARVISLLSILQVAALCAGILFTAVFCRISERFMETHLPGLPAATSGFQLACRFRDHGVWLILVILAWAVTAAILSVRNDLPWVAEQTVAAAGFALLAILGVGGFWFSILATTPLWT